MSKELRLAVVALAGVVLLYFALGSLLPSHWSVETRVSLPQPCAKVQPYLVDFQSWLTWTTLKSTERADTTVAIAGEKGTPGHEIRWTSNANEAALRLLQADGNGLDYEFLSRLGKGAELRVRGRGSIRCVEDEKGCVVVWKDQSELDGLTERWFAWFGAQQETARQFQQASLANLRILLEGA